MGPVAAWSLGIVGVDQIVNIIVTRVAASAPFKASEQLHMSQLDVAGNASYQNAYTIYMLPYSLIAVSIATAIFPKNIESHRGPQYRRGAQGSELGPA